MTSTWAADRHLLAARAAAFAMAFIWAVVGQTSWHPLVIVALTLLAGNVAFAARDVIAGRAALAVRSLPALVVVADALAAATYMAGARGTQAVPIVLFIAAVFEATLRFGSRGAAATAVLYTGARLSQETTRMSTPLTLGTDLVVGTAVIALLAWIAHAYGRERDRAARALRLAHTLERVATEIAGETELDAVLRTVSRSALALVDADHVATAIRYNAEFELAAGAGLGERVTGMRFPIAGALFEQVLDARRSIVLTDYSANPSMPPAVRDLGIRPMAGIPIFVHGEIAALLAVGRVAPRTFSADEVRVLEALTAHAAIAIRNARLIEQSRRLEALSRTAADRDTDSVMRAVADEVAAAFSAEFVVLARVVQGTSEIVAALGAAEPLAGRTGAPLGPVMRDAVETRKLVFLRDYVGERGGAIAEAPSGMLARDVGLHATMVAPIVIGDDVAALLVAGTTDPHRTFDVIDRQGMSSFADTAAVALRAAAVRQERERRIQRLAALNVLGWRMALIHDAAEIAKRAAETAASLVARDAFYVALYDEERQVFDFILEQDGDDVRLGESVTPLGTGPTSQVVLTGRTHTARTAEDEVHVTARTFGDASRRSESAVHVPLRSGGRVIGVLSAQSYARDAYDAEDVAVLQSLANLVATALENAQHLERTRELYLASVKALAAAVDARDPYTRSHSARVSALARAIAIEMDLPTDMVRQVQLGALLHDIGKIGIPDAILNKPSGLSPEEWLIMRTHSALGASIVAAVEPLRELVPIVRAHHERYDGTGYPDGLRGEEIPLGAFIVAAADAFEVIVSKRAYKTAQSVEYAVQELRRCSGGQFAPIVVDAMVRLVERDRDADTGFLRRVGSMDHEDIDDLPGPSSVLARFATRSHTHTRQLSILQRLASEISAVLDLEELAARLLAIVCESMGYEHGFVCTADDGGEALVVRAAVGPTSEFIGFRLERGEGLSWAVMDRGEVLNVKDTRADPRFVGPDEVRSSLIVPLRIGEERVGVLGMESTRLAAFRSDDEDLLVSVSHQIAAALRVARLHEAAKAAAATDPLTGLANRRVFFERLSSGLAGGADDSGLAIALVDVDGLKQLNDARGHAAGDDALKRVAALLAAGVRSQDLVARVGGDEFGVIFPATPVLAAERIMRRLAETVAAGTAGDGARLPTISWGVAVSDATRVGADVLFDAADRAMYRQKRRSTAAVV